ncbi:phosphoesterase family protein [Compostimonas suwonensis]|uniref:Phosphoesterase family protein n=2 Tax=Compostimonas suwonensis TaxID=1048394 RepID=A0A2M9BZQ3_9MICO|nr:phosphoesterase family protein [Compostimonas suwonensis]
MFHGRSFDDVLGRLYPQGLAPDGLPFDGVTNGMPPDGSPPEPPPYAGSTDEIMTTPQLPAPGATGSGFTPEMLPVLSALARGFAVCEAWQSVPGADAFENRRVFHNGPDAAAPSLFARLDRAGLSWRIYVDEAERVSLTALLHAQELGPRLSDRLRTMDDLRNDLAEGSLPSYSVVEPRMILSPNDFEPSATAGSAGEGPTRRGRSDARAAEALLHTVYEAIRVSPLAGDTALLVTADTPGVTADHRGSRVPAVVVSPWSSRGSVVRAQSGHGTAAEVVLGMLGVARSARADSVVAPVLRGILTRQTPREPRTWPRTTAPFVPRRTASNASAGAERVTGLGGEVLRLVARGTGGPDVRAPETAAEAAVFLGDNACPHLGGHNATADAQKGI